MRPSAALCAATALLVAGGAQAAAHHSISGAYDHNREVTIEGAVARFEFVNPHPFVWLDVRSGDAVQRWQLEMDNRGELTRAGIFADTLKPGDRLVVTGSLARREPHRLYIQRLDRHADGFGYEQVGNRPRLRSRAR